MREEAALNECSRRGNESHHERFFVWLLHFPEKYKWFLYAHFQLHIFVLELHYSSFVWFIVEKKYPYLSSTGPLCSPSVHPLPWPPLPLPISPNPSDWPISRSLLRGSCPVSRGECSEECENKDLCAQGLLSHMFPSLSETLAMFNMNMQQWRNCRYPITLRIRTSIPFFFHFWRWPLHYLKAALSCCVCVNIFSPHSSVPFQAGSCFRCNDCAAPQQSWKRRDYQASVKRTQTWLQMKVM